VLSSSVPITVTEINRHAEIIAMQAAIFRIGSYAEKLQFALANLQNERPSGVSEVCNA
jgi:hypothetical protein